VKTIFGGFRKGFIYLRWAFGDSEDCVSRLFKFCLEITWSFKPF